MVGSMLTRGGFSGYELNAEIKASVGVNNPGASKDSEITDVANSDKEDFKKLAKEKLEQRVLTFKQEVGEALVRLAEAVDNYSLAKAPTDLYGSKAFREANSCVFRLLQRKDVSEQVMAPYRRTYEQLLSDAQIIQASSASGMHYKRKKGVVEENGRKC